jgi:O-antigen ligase
MTSLATFRGRYRVLVSAAVAVSVVLVFISPRTQLLIKDFNKTVNNLDYNATESASVRLILWRSAGQIVKENFLTGVGTGDGEVAMLDKTEKVNKLAFENRLNAHNQFLETAMTLGVTGLLIILLLLCYPIYLSLKYNDWLFLSFMLIIAGNMMFESIFQTFAGIMFFAFFFSLFVLYLQKKIHADPPAILSR